MKKDIDLTSWKTIWNIAWPVAIENVLFTILLLVDLYWVGSWGGDPPLNALGILGPIIWTTHAAASFVFYGILAMIARSVGKGDKKSATLVSYQGLIVATIAGFIIGIAGIIVSDSFLSLYSITPEVHDMASGYMKLVFGSIPPLYLYMGLFAIFTAHNNTKHPMIIALVAWIINFALDPLFVFGWKFIPEMGVIGAGLATFIAHTMALVAFFLFYQKPFRRYVPWSGIRELIPNWKIIKEIIKLGTPASINGISRPLSGTIVMYIVTLFGQASVAGFGIVVRIISVNWIYLGGLNMAVSTLVGQNLGRKSVNDAQTAVKKSFTVGISIQILVSAILIIFSTQVVSLFNPSAETLKEAKYLMILFAAGTLSDVLIAVYGGALNGAGDTVRAMLSSVFANWVFKIPLILLFFYGYNAEVEVIYWIVMISIPIEGIINFIFYKLGAWKKKKLIVDQEIS